MAHLIKTTEVYRVETEDEAKKFIEEQKQNDSYEMIKYSSEYKIKKAKGEIEDEWFRVTLVKNFTDEKDPVELIKINYERN
jgi:5-methylcytosine-specific restriction endonuclease McrBC regulatory subunit McrC